MPLYEYQCDACAHRFEQIQKFSDPLLTSCARCGGAVRKLVSSSAIQFKGAGWYVTDYARAGRKDPSETAEKPEASSEGSASKPQGKDAGKSGKNAGKSGDAKGASAPAADSSKSTGSASAGSSS